MLVSAIQQLESAISMYMSLLFWVSLPPPQPPSLPPRSSQSTKLSFLCSTAASHWIFILDVVLYVHQCCSLSLSHAFLSLVHQSFVCKYIFIFHLLLYLKFYEIFMNLLLSVIIRTLMVANKGPFGQGYGFFQWSCMDARVGLWRKLSTEELMLLNRGVGEDSWESLGLQGDPTSPF